MQAGRNDDMNNSETTAKAERTRIGTVVDTRAASAGTSATDAPSASTEKETDRIGTKVDTRGASDKSSSQDKLRDGSK